MVIGFRRSGLPALLLLCCAAVFVEKAAQAKDFPVIEIVSADKPSPMAFAVSDTLRPRPAFETPPVLMTAAGNLYYFATTGWSWLCRASGSFLNDPQLLGPGNCAFFSSPKRIDPRTGENADPSDSARSGHDWRLNYSGAMSVVAPGKPLDGYDRIVAMHGENKNERLGDKLYANTVNRDVTPSACASGYANGHYDDCWTAYNAFVSLTLLDTKSGAKRDLGPVIWPTMGYTRNGKKTSSGVRQPSLFLADRHLYVYYQDTSQGNDPERRGGAHVARIDLGRNSTTTTPVALPYSSDGFQDSNPSLPAGFDKRSIQDFYGSLGGRAAELWPDSWQTVCFRVARVAGAPFYLGVEEFGSPAGWGVRLRVSGDLVHWSDPVSIPGLAARNWREGALHYPVFVNASGESTDVIDPADFYILGARTNAGVVRQRLSVKLKR